VDNNQNEVTHTNATFKIIGIGMQKKLKSVIKIKLNKGPLPSALFRL
jgi:hypothetical protein